MAELEDPLSMFCGSPLWNASRTWATEEPEAGVCMQRTLLVWAPCLLLWLCAPASLLVQRRAPALPLPWSPLLVSRVCLPLVLAVTAAAGMVMALPGVLPERAPPPSVDLLASLALLASYLLVAAMVVVGRRWYGRQTSGTLWVFWVTLVLCGLPQLWATVTALVDGDDHLSHPQAITFLVQYAGAVVMLVLSCFADQHHRHHGEKEWKKECPEVHASFLSQITFHWANRVLWTGWQRPLTHQDLWALPEDCTSGSVGRKWHAAWTKEEEALRQKTSPLKEESIYGGGGCPLRVSLLKVVLRVHLWNYLLIFFTFLTSEMLLFLTPRILGLLIAFTTDPSEPTWHGYLYACLLLLINIVSTLLRHAFMYQAFKICLRMRSAYMTSVYRKALTLSSAARRESTVGEIVNLMAVDSRRLSEFIVILNVGIATPITITFLLSELWKILGPSVLAGLAVMLLLIPTSSVIANRIKVLQGSQMTHKDKRIRLASEIINGIKVLKLYAWEESFRNQVDEVRGEEVKIIRKSMYLESFVSFIWRTTTYMVSLASFVTFTLLSKENVLDAEMAFTSIALFNLMRMPLVQLPSIIAQGIQAGVSLRRLEKFLAASNLDPNAVCRDNKEKGAIMVRGGYFTWHNKEGTEEEGAAWRLQEVELEVPRGQLVAVVGPVGAGKSSLLAAILGNMEKTSGVVIVNGDVAYASQQVWLQNASLRQNITWGLDWEEERYWQVVEACALKPDFDMLPAGDLTEIGEKGINLSGGQKQRVSLARAAYSRASVMLLDDPLSAVDSHVGRHIFDRLIGPGGLMKDKTRVLVTHAVWTLPQVDCVVVMEDGRVVERGSFTRLLEDEGNFSHFLLQYFSGKVKDDDDDDGLEELCEQLESTNKGGQAVAALVRQISQQSSASSEIIAIPGIRKRHTSQISSASSRGQWRLEESDRRLASSTSMSDAKDEEKEAMIELKKKPGEVLVETETTSTGKVKWKVYCFFAQAMGLLNLMLPLLFFFIAQGMQAGANVWLSVWSSTAPSSDPNNASANATEDFDRVEFLAGYTGFGIGQSVFFFVSTVLLWVGCLRAGREVHHRLLGSVLRLPTRFFDTNPSGRIMSRFSKEMEALDSKFPNMLVNAFGCVTQMIVTLLVVVASTPVVGLVVLPVMVVYLVVLVVFVSSHRQMKRIDSLASSPVFSYFAETVQGVSTIRAFRQQESFIRNCEEKVDCSIQAFQAIVIVNRWLAVRLESMGSIISFVVALIAVTGRDVLSPGTVGLSLTYAVSLPFILNLLVRMCSDVEANIVSVERIKEYIEEEKEAPWRVEGGPHQSWPDAGTITFSDYRTRYRPGLELVLKGVTCSIDAGEKVGIVGRTGAGKSSLVLAMFRMVEAASGTISIDGKDISHLGLHDLRGRITIIPQDPVLFSGSLRFNLDPSGIHADSAIWHALELAHLRSLVQAQPLGLQMVVDEGGSNLSVGQRQLVSLARALLRKTRILVLDEATAAVDLETDDLIQATIRNEFSHCTILTIAHRLNTIMDVNRVMVMHEGRIAEFSAPSTLLAQKDSIFYGMAKDAGLVQEAAFSHPAEPQ